MHISAFTAASQEELEWDVDDMVEFPNQTQQKATTALSCQSRTLRYSLLIPYPYIVNTNKLAG